MKIKRNIFLTGGSGFIGNKIIEELNNDYFLTVLTRSEKISTNDSIKYVHGDLLTLDENDPLFKQIDVIIHAAGEKKDEQKMFDLNVLGSRKIASIIQHNKHLKLIHISSGGVFGLYNQPLQVIDEDSACFPKNIYEKTKYLAENEIKKISVLNSYIILRPTNVFGENDTSNKLLNLISLVKAHRFYYLNKNAMVNYLYVGQLSFVIKKLLEIDQYNNGMFIVNAPCNISQLIEIIKIKLPVTYKLKALPKFAINPIRLMASIFDLLPQKLQKINSGKLNEMTSEKYYNAKKINDYLGGFDEKKFLDEGIQSLISYYKNKQLI